MSCPRIVLGGATAFGSPEAPNTKFTNRKEAQAAVNLFRKYGHDQIDTSRRYPSEAPGTSEEVIGLTDIKTWGLVDTKVLSYPGKHTPTSLAESVEESLRALQMNKTNLMYFHFPDRETPLEDALRGMDDLHKQGKFEKFGISNYSVEEVEQMMQICERMGYIKPSVYQGSYSAVTRRAEEELIPLLKRHNISFYAFSPAAGGIFSKNSSRMNSKAPVGDYYRSMFANETMAAAVAKVQDAAEAAGLDGHGVALRWVLHHSALKAEDGDAMIIGASGLEQLERTLKICDAGPLPQHLIELMEEVWQEARPTAPSYSAWVKTEGGTDHLSKITNYMAAHKK